MERLKDCSICGDKLSITEFSKKQKYKWRSYCKSCKAIKNEMMKAKKIEPPKLDQGVEIEVRGRLANGHGYTYSVPYEKAIQMVDERVAYIVHERLIRKFFDRDTFRKLIFKRFGEICFYCGEVAETIDHIIPKSRGGLSSFSNCVPACSKCNESKSNMSVDDFLYYFDLYSIIPDSSQKEYVRFDFMKLSDKLDKFNSYFNMCLEKCESNEGEFDILVDLEKLEGKVTQIKETIMRYKVKQNLESLV
ncbi:HNH endonuclease [Fredinandcohnia onubensis]|uniref:HNH endonuclease n=1 Tax=Fredinandcohnia onubensis TaxID=1571209 RepID=UPI0015D4D1EB|nr:HNH endonuclease [Fredinandcohnia onubensis]